MSRLTGMQIFELMNGIRDGLIAESIPPSWLGGKAPAPGGAIVMDTDPVESKKKNVKARRNRKKTVILPLWLGKGGWLAAALALLVAAGLAVTLFALRDGRKDDPKDTEGESVTEAFEDLTGFDAADRLLSQLVIPPEGTHMKLDVKTDVRTMMENGSVTAGVRQKHTGSLTVAGQQFDIIRTPDGGETERFTYDGSHLYIITSERKVKSVFTDADTATLAGFLREDLALPAEQPFLSAEFLFETVTVKTTDNGHMQVICQGLRTEAIESVIPVVRPTLEFMGMVAAYDYHPDYEEYTVNYEEEDQQTRELLALAKGEALTVTLTAKPDGTLASMTVEADVVEETYVEGTGNVLSEIEIKSTVTANFGTQKISPDKSKSYTERHWRLIFNHPNAEAVGLIPDAEGVYHITATNSPVWDEQIHYVMDHPDELLGKTFHIVGYYWGLGGQWPQDRYATSIHGSNKNGFCIYAPIIMPYDMFEANRSKLQNSNQTNPKMEIYATLTIDDLSLDGTSKGPIFAVERIVFPE